VHEQFLPTTLNAKIAHVLEETGEVSQMIGKIYRFGLTSRNPLKPNDPRDNRRLLLDELWDLRLAISSLMYELNQDVDNV
jgi:NTP pyrophosphatase (non-canonical NTP hydrolase)